MEIPNDKIVGENKDKMLALISGGDIDPTSALKICLRWMSDEEVGKMLEANALRIEAIKEENS